MNCKPGDLAVFVKSWCGNEGKIVRTVRLATEAELQACGFVQTLGAVWVLEQYLPAIRQSSGKRLTTNFAVDAFLRPIRDPGEDATDETLTWIPVPSRDREAA